MKDFLVIFVGLCLGVGGFMAGRNYGESTFRDSADYRELIRAQEELKFTRAELETAKTKFQNIVDSAAIKKPDELLAQMLSTASNDLGVTASIQPPLPLAKSAKPAKQFNFKRLKSYEWILTNSRDQDEVRKNLKNVEIKNLDLLLTGASQPAPEELKDIFGDYRGRIIDVNKNEYGSLAVQIFPQQKPDAETLLKGSIKIFKNGQEQSSKSFLTNQLAYQAQESSGFLIDNGSLFYQVYKISETQQLSGFMYERMVNGTTKTIGSFVLNRTDQF